MDVREISILSRLFFVIMGNGNSGKQFKAIADETLLAKTTKNRL